MARKGQPEGGGRRIVIVAVGAAAVLGLAWLASHLRDDDTKDKTPPSPSTVTTTPTSAPLAPDSSVLDASQLSRSDRDDASVDASAVDATDASDAADAADGATEMGAAYAVDFRAGPWALEHRTVERGFGQCGGMESTIYPRIRYESDGGALTRDTATIDESCPHGVSRTNVVEKIFDYDGDGSPELLVVTETVGPQGITGDESAIWTVKNSRIVPYQPRDSGPPPAFAEVDDVDKDGRPDLLSRFTYTEIGSPPSCGVGFVVAPVFVFHSLPGGDFSARDAVAKKHLDDTCPSDTLDTVLEQAGDLGNAIVCTRAHGATADAVERTLRKRCATFTDTACDTTETDAGKRIACPTWSLSLAKKPPPPR